MISVVPIHNSVNGSGFMCFFYADDITSALAPTAKKINTFLQDYHSLSELYGKKPDKNTIHCACFCFVVYVYSSYIMMLV